ncbi:MAG TPA: hypothetical protein PKZ15_11515, partial [Paludibacteraceae bacterium]|nr:hypothetical protein [Paludibacteraceae bacterium]
MKLITQRRKYGSQGQRFAVCCLLLCAFLLNGFSVVAQEHNTETNTISNVANDFKETQSVARAADVLENGLSYSMPVTFPYIDNGPFALKLSFDSLRFIRGEDIKAQTDDKILVNADATFNFPFATSSDGSHIVHFKGTDVPLGGAATTRISLVSEHKIELMKNKVWVDIMPNFKKDNISKRGCVEDNDSTWLEFDCNGVQDMSLCGRFEFNQSFIESANPTSANKSVYAYFSFIYSSGMIAKVCFTDSFKIKGCGDFVFKVTDAIIDLSDDRNASGFSLPTGYYDNVALTEQMWTGFFLRALDVTLPKNLDLNKKKDKQAEIQIRNMMLDDYGLTGNILVTGFVDTGAEGKNSGLALRVDTIGVSFWQNDLSDGLISGSMDVPFLDSVPSKGSGDGNENEGVAMDGYNLGFRGRIGYNRVTDKFLYSVNVKLNTEKTFKVPFTNKATVKLARNSYLEIGTLNTTEDFAATLCLNGELNIESTLDFKGVKFEGLKLSSLSPHIELQHMAMIGSAGFSLGGFGIQLTRLEATLRNETDFDLGIDAQISLMAGSGGICAGVGMDIRSKFDDSKWKVKGLEIQSIMLDLDFSAFHFYGMIKRFNNSNEYGDGFQGELTLTLKEFDFGVNGQVTFGRKDGLKYWFTNATVDLSGAKILLFPPGVFLKSFTGGA